MRERFIRDIEAKMKELGVHPAELGRIIGVGRYSVSDWLSGRHFPGHANIGKIYRTIGLDYRNAWDMDVERDETTAIPGGADPDPEPELDPVYRAPPEMPEMQITMAEGGLCLLLLKVKIPCDLALRIWGEVQRAMKKD